MSTAIVAPVAPVPAPAAVMAGLVGELCDVLDRVAGQAGAGTITAVRGPALVELTAALWACVDRATAVAVHATGELHVCGELRAAGFVTTRAWLRRVVGLADRDAKAAVARAMSLRSDLTATWAAWNTGAITGAAAREISLGLASVYRAQPTAVRDAETPVAEAILLEVARVGTVADVASMVENLRAAVDADGTTAAALAAHEDQSLSCAPVGAMVALTGYLSKESHALLATALEAIIDGWYRTGALPPADQPTGEDYRDARTRSLRRPHLWALALTELARRQLENALLGSRHGVKPHVSVLVDLDRHTAGLPSQLRVPGQPDPSWLGRRVDPPDPVRRRPHHRRRHQRRRVSRSRRVTRGRQRVERHGRPALERRPAPRRVAGGPARPGPAHRYRPDRVAARPGPHRALRRPGTAHRASPASRRPRDPRPALRVPRLHRRRQPLRRPSRRALGTRRPHRPRQPAPALPGPPPPRPRRRLAAHRHRHRPRPQRLLAVHPTPTTTPALTQGAPPTTRPVDPVGAPR